MSKHDIPQKFPHLLMCLKIFRLMLKVLSGHVESVEWTC